MKSINRFKKREPRRNGSRASCSLRSNRSVAEDDTLHPSGCRTAWRKMFE